MVYEQMSKLKLYFIIFNSDKVSLFGFERSRNNNPSKIIYFPLKL